MNRTAVPAVFSALLVFICLMAASPRAAQEAPKKDGPVAPANVTPGPAEKPHPLETQTIDEAGKVLGGKIDKLGEEASSEVGKWINIKVYKGLTLFKLVLCVCLLMMVFIAERLFRYWIKSMVRKARNGETSLAMISDYVDGFLKPISLFILVYGTYASLSPLYAYFQRADGSNYVHALMKRGAEIGGVAAVFWLAYLVILGVDDQIKRKVPPGESFRGSLVTRCGTPLRIFVMLVLARMLLPLLGHFPYVLNVLGNVLAILLISTVSWLLTRVALVLEELVLGYYRVDVEDNLRARRVQTQARFFRRIITTVIIIVGGASVLMLFEQVRQLGTGILTSAGILGVVVGLAAQRSISNLLVGLQIAITQPLRLDDVVVIENEWGRIEEITSTYAVVKIWDLRRLIVPLTYFTEKPFQNWTRTSAAVLGTVQLNADYTIPVDAVRAELLRILERSKYWDGNVWALQVTNATEHTIELRALMSAPDASLCWDLRCEVREGLITFIQKNFPQSLPRARAEILAEKKSGPVLEREEV